MFGNPLNGTWTIDYGASYSNIAPTNGTNVHQLNQHNIFGTRGYNIIHELNSEWHPDYSCQSSHSTGSGDFDNMWRGQQSSGDLILLEITFISQALFNAYTWTFRLRSSGYNTAFEWHFHPELSSIPAQIQLANNSEISIGEFHNSKWYVKIQNFSDTVIRYNSPHLLSIPLHYNGNGSFLNAPLDATRPSLNIDKAINASNDSSRVTQILTNLLRDD